MRRWGARGALVGEYSAVVVKGEACVEVVRLVGHAGAASVI